MKKLEVKPASDLLNLMITQSLTRRDIARLTNSGMRSVTRWREIGIPVGKWELLNLKLESKQGKASKHAGT